MKSNVMKDKTLTMEEGRTSYQKNYDELCSNRAEKNSKWIRCIQLTKVIFYLVMILFVGWFAIMMFLSEYTYYDYAANKNATRELMIKDQNVDNTAVNSNIIPAEDVIGSKIEEDMIVTTTEKNEILLSKCFFEQVKLDSSNDKSDLSEDSPVSKLIFGKIEQSPSEKSVNVEDDKEKFDSSDDQIISKEDSEMSTKELISFLDHMVDDLISATNFHHEVLDDTDKTRDDVDKSLFHNITIQDFYDKIYNDDVNLSSPDMPEAVMEPEHSARKHDEDIQDDYAKNPWPESLFPFFSDPAIWDNDYTTSEEIDY